MIILHYRFIKKRFLSPVPVETIPINCGTAHV